jgi:hypothetical protein
MGPRLEQCGDARICDHVPIVHNRGADRNVP